MYIISQILSALINMDKNQFFFFYFSARIPSFTSIMVLDLVIRQTVNRQRNAARLVKVFIRWTILYKDHIHYLSSLWRSDELRRNPSEWAIWGLSCQVCISQSWIFQILVVECSSSLSYSASPVKTLLSSWSYWPAVCGFQQQYRFFISL